MYFRSDKFLGRFPFNKRQVNGTNISLEDFFWKVRKVEYLKCKLFNCKFRKESHMELKFFARLSSLPEPPDNVAPLGGRCFPRAKIINTRSAPVKTSFVSAEILSETLYFHM